MKLLFDENLAASLCPRLSDVFPESSHIASHAKAATDLEIWRLAKEQGFTVVTKDADFDNLAILDGNPPKVIRIRLGNCTTTAVEILMRTSVEKIKGFVADGEESLLLLP